ncbi:hypothetical protein FA10DRAFT_284094 [Acaromyces ingoldii]|uniref:Zn(2)-C6 fungal-type domain-containing protein n=1 Tax=Acaromyces ingoldii TaxID=215250 RepID=A0A316YR52_9BASI|nr:hypothetical protein FA10DRAFT_284094 [Acaromyces ingoldii]PWN91148.1 hypothetical protein FA10DRAFT_284094 [Acaromyces ingoldii]
MPMMQPSSSSSISISSGGGGAPREPQLEKRKKKRRRRGPRPQVCANCRRLKLKCDRARPCRHCERREIQCIYRLEAEEAAEEEDEGEDEEGVAGEDDAPDAQSQQAASGLVAAHAGEQRHPLGGSASNGSPSQRSASDSSSSSTSTSSHLLKRPTAQYSRDTWFDHLLDFFGPSRSASHRTVAYLVDQSMSWASSNHWFEMIYLPGLKRDIQLERNRSRVNPALAFALTAVALRERTAWQQGRRPYGIGPGHTLIADEMLPAAQSPYDVSERIKVAAQAYLEQSIVCMQGAAEAGGAISIVQSAQAALLLMLLETEVSPGCMYYLGLASSLVLRSPHAQATLDHEAATTTGNRFQDSPMQRPMCDGTVARSSTQVEEVARLRLLPVWWGSRIGMAYFNVEIANSIYRPTDMDSAYVFGPWPEEHSSVTEKGENDFADSVRARILGLNVMATNLQSRFLPYELDYSQPTEALAKVLKCVDDDEFIFSMLLEALDWEAQTFFTFMVLRFCTSICHLHGMLIRRLGFAHSDALRPRICARLRGEQPASDDGQLGGSNITFQSPILSTWPDVLRRYMKEMDEDYAQAVARHQHSPEHFYGSASPPSLPQQATPHSSSLRLTKFQLDVLKLYVAATIHLRNGVMEALKLAGRSENDIEDEVLVVRLKDAMDDLSRRIRRHQDAFNEGV